MKHSPGMPGEFVPEPAEPAGHEALHQAREHFSKKIQSAEARIAYVQERLTRIQESLQSPQLDAEAHAGFTAMKQEAQEIAESIRGDFIELGDMLARVEEEWEASKKRMQ